MSASPLAAGRRAPHEDSVTGGGWESCEGRCGHRVLATHGRDETGRRPLLLDNADRDGPLTLAEHTATRCRALREAP